MDGMENVKFHYRWNMSKESTWVQGFGNPESAVDHVKKYPDGVFFVYRTRTIGEDDETYHAIFLQWSWLDKIAPFYDSRYPFPETEEKQHELHPLDVLRCMQEAEMIKLVDDGNGFRITSVGGGLYVTLYTMCHGREPEGCLDPDAW